MVPVGLGLGGWYIALAVPKVPLGVPSETSWGLWGAFWELLLSFPAPPGPLERETRGFYAPSVMAQRSIPDVLLFSGSSRNWVTSRVASLSLL